MELEGRRWNTTQAGGEDSAGPSKGCRVLWLRRARLKDERTLVPGKARCVHQRAGRYNLRRS